MKLETDMKLYVIGFDILKKRFPKNAQKVPKKVFLKLFVFFGH